MPLFLFGPVLTGRLTEIVCSSEFPPFPRLVCRPC
jgi:hypothetical protein